MNHYQFREDIKKTLLNGILKMIENALLQPQVDLASIEDRLERIRFIIESVIDEYADNHTSSVITERSCKHESETLH